MKWIEIDGSQGEGGGQILRSSLSLSMITGKPVRIQRIRAGRAKPGLMRQHLTAVLAAQQICQAQVSGVQLGSTSLTFIPGSIKAGDYFFDLGGAGSCALVLQTILPALWSASGVSRVILRGGTHNPMAPSVTFLQQVWLPLIAKMGAVAELTLHRYGFYPAGGGEVEAVIHPVKAWQPLNLTDRGQIITMTAQALTANINVDKQVANRELQVIKQQFNLPDQQLQHLSLAPVAGSGNAVLLHLQYEQLAELVCVIGSRGKPAELVAQEVCAEAQMYLDSNAAVAEHLADQLLLPMALAGKGSFTTHQLTDHLKTNAEVIRQFLNVVIKITPQDKVFCVDVDSNVLF